MTWTEQYRTVSGNLINIEPPTTELEAIFEAMADAVSVFDAHGRLVRLNAAMATLVGWKQRSDYLALPVEERESALEMLDMDGRPLPREQWPALRALHGETLTGVHAVDIRARTLDGRDLVLNVSSAPTRNANGDIVGAVCISRDVTEQRRTERELAERASQLEGIFETMTDGVLLCDAQGNMVRANPALNETFAFSRFPEFSATTPGERGQILHMRDMDGRPLTVERMPGSRALRGEILKGATAQDVRMRALDGREVDANISAAPVRDQTGRIIGAVLVYRDVTERRRMERELAERAGEIESIFEAMTDGLMYCDTEGRIVRMNAAQRVMLDLDVASDAVGAFVADQAPQYTLRDAQNHPMSQDQWPLYRMLRGETLTGERAVEMHLRTPNGREMIVSVSGAPIRNGHRRIIGAVSATRDVTELRRLEQQRIAIVRTVAHDLVNPLAAVRLYVQSQQRRLSKGETPFVPNETLLTSMEHAVVRIERLMRDLRVATSIETGTLRLELAPCDLTELCHKEVEVQRAVTGRDVRLMLPDVPVVVIADETRVGQVVANLLSNAIKYSPAEQPVVLSLRTEAKHARVAVRDEGPGISPAEQQRIWEQFHRVSGIETQDGASGLGLGLFISKAIIDQHHGHIGVDSEVGHGSTFWFTLPLMSATQ